MTDALPEREVERLLTAAFADARETIVEHPDLFVRVERSIDEDRARRRFRTELGGGIALFLAAIASLAFVLSDFREGRIVMPWWVIELITNIVLVTIAVALGPFIKRFGRAYAADVFRATPRTGKSYLVLTDVAYYLIFTAFIMFTVRFEESQGWAASRSELYEHELARIGGILLIMGALHAANVVALPVIANLLAGDRGPLGAAGPPGAPPIGPGTWIVRVEASPDPRADPAPDSHV